MMASRIDSRVVLDSLREAALAAGIAALLALPLLGIRLSDSAQGGPPEYRLMWVLYAAIAVFVGRLAITYGRLFLGQMSFLPRVKIDRVLSHAWFEPAMIAAMVALANALPLLPFAERNLIDRATLILIYVLLATGLNIVVGLAGLLDLGYIAFYAVGAYSYALLTQDLGLTFWAALPIAGVFSATFGLLLVFPVLRLRCDYLAIVTLGFGQIVHTVLVNWTELTGGPNGISGIVRPSLFGLSF